MTRAAITNMLLFRLMVHRVNRFYSYFLCVMASHCPSFSKVVCCWVWITLVAVKTNAQTSEIAFEGLIDPKPVLGSSDFITKTWGIQEGLPRTGIKAIAQTPDGFLWLGLERGLARFDGTHFKLYSPTSYPNLVKRPISTLFVDGQGKLWIGSDGDNASVMEDSHFKKLDNSTSLSQSEVFQFAEDADGVIWRASSYGIHFYVNDVAQPIPAAESFEGTSYRVVYDSNSGRIFGCYWESAGKWDNSKFISLKEFRSDRTIVSNNFFRRRDGGIWFLSSDLNDYGALHRLLPSGKVTPAQSWPFKIPHYGISAFLESSDRALWISVSKDAVYRLGKDGVYERFDIGNGTVSSLFEDQDGSIWAGSPASGLYRIRRRLFRSYPAAAPDSAHMLFTDHKGGVIFTQGEQVRHIDHKGTFSTFGVEVYYGALLDRQGALWSGISGGLAKWVSNGTNFRADTFDRRQMFFGCQSMFEAESGELWIGGHAGNLARIKNGETIEMSIENDSVTAFAEAGNGDLWIGFFSGKTLRNHNAEPKQETALPDFTNNVISSIHVDTDQSLWIATLGDGLFHWDKKRLTQFTKAKGLPSDEIGGVISSNDAIWITTTKGVGRILKSQFSNKQVSRTSTVQCLVFGIEDGLPNLECSTTYFPSVHASENGTLWFATVEGVASIDPTSIPKEAVNPMVYIEEIRIDDKLAPFRTDSIIVPPGPARLSFSFTAITLNEPRQARFQYRLEGHDENWVDARSKREAHYTKPRPGNYRFRVRASDYSGGWSVRPASLAIQIKPFIWQKREFQISTGLLAAVLIALTAWFAARGVYLERIQYLVRARAVERERSRIAEDLHDRLGAHSTQIIFQSKELNEQAKQQGHSKLNVVSEQIQATAQDMTLSLDEIIWATDPAKDNLESSMAFFLSYAESYFKDTQTRLRVDVPLNLEKREIPTEFRHHLFLAFKEALTNVLKHAQASIVWLRIRLEGVQLQMTIEDDGIGMPVPPGGGPRNGLSNIKRRIDSIGGKVEFSKNETGGLTLRIAAPMPQS